MPGPFTPSPANPRPPYDRPSRRGPQGKEEGDPPPDPAYDFMGNDVDLTDDDHEIATSRDDNDGDGLVREKDILKVPPPSPPPLPAPPPSLPHTPTMQVPGSRNDQPRKRREYLNFLNGIGYMMDIHQHFHQNWRQLTQIEVCVCVCACVCVVCVLCVCCVCVCCVCVVRACALCACVCVRCYEHTFSFTTCAGFVQIEHVLEGPLQACLPATEKR